MRHPPHTNKTKKPRLIKQVCKINIVLLQQRNVELLGQEDISGEASFVFSTIKTMNYFFQYTMIQNAHALKKKNIAHN